MNSQNILNNPQTPQIHPPTSQPLTTSHASERLNLNDKKQAFQSYYSKINPFVFSQDLIEIAPQIKTLEKLLEYENKIDKILSKKRVDIQEQLLRPFPKIKRILRVHVYNTYNIMEEPPSWTLRIEGKLLNNEKNGSGCINRKFSYFFRIIQIVFDDNNNPAYKPITWKKQNMSSETDALEIKRPASEEMEINIALHLYSNPQKFKINDKLANILGYSHASRATVLSALWEYIKLNRLQDKENRNIINNDFNLRQIFECDKMSLDTVTLRLKNLLEAPQPIILKHNLKLSGDITENEKYYDIIVEYDYPIHFELMPFMSHKISDDKHVASKTLNNYILFIYNEIISSNPENSLIKLAQNLKKFEKQSGDLIEQMHRHKWKRDCYQSYASNPETFIDNMIIQQNQLLKVFIVLFLNINKKNKVMNNKKDLKRKFEEFNDPEFAIYNEDLIDKEIRKYLEDKQIKPTT